MRSILVVDDNPAARKLVSGYLAPFGEVHTAENGQQAVESFRNALEADQPYELVILDIMMPVMDGLSALKLIRGLEKQYRVPFGQEAVVIICTALDDTDAVWDATFSGLASGYFFKPLKRKALLRRLRELQIVPAGESAGKDAGALLDADYDDRFEDHFDERPLDRFGDGS